MEMSPRSRGFHERAAKIVEKLKSLEDELPKSVTYLR